MLSELNTLPGCTSVNASPRRLPDATHHSRPRRLARSYLVRLFHSLPSPGLCRRTPSIVVGLLLLIAPIFYSVLRTRGTSTNPAESQRLSHYPFLLALASLFIGGLAFIVGLGAAFSRAGNWANDLAELGIVLFFLAALSNITAFEAGSISLIREKLFHWWLPFSFIGLLVTIYSAWVAVHL